MSDIFHRHMTQKVSSDPNWRVNCTAYCAAMLYTDATLGGVEITGRIVRALSSEPHPSPGSPGLNITQIIDVGHQLRIPLSDNQKQSWQLAEHALENGVRILMQVDYKELGAYRCQANGDFGHAIVLIRPADQDGFIRASDPLCHESKRYPISVVKEAARVFARNTGVSVGLRWASTRAVPETVKSID